MTPKKYTLVSVFTGIAGLDLGFKGNFTYKKKKYAPQSFENIASFEMEHNRTGVT